MTDTDDTEWDLQPEYGRNGAPWVRRTFGPLLGFDVDEDDERE